MPHAGSLHAVFGLPRRLALGFTESATPGLLFVGIGALLGPEALNAITLDVLARLDPVVSMALAVVGVFVGAGFASATHTGRALGGAAGQGGLTFAAVWLAMAYLVWQWDLALPVSPAVAAAVLAMCSMASAAILPARGPAAEMREAAVIADLDDVPVVVLGSVVIPLLAGVPSLGISLLLGVAAAAVIAWAGLLLFHRAESAAERGAFVAGILLLLGGVAAYSSLSPLTTGFVAGVLWMRQRPAADREFVGPDLKKLQHPLLGLLLIAAGASMQWSWAALWLAAPLAIVRLAGKTAGALVFAGVARLSAGLLGAVLLPPGILGIALALNVQQVLGGDTLLLSAVTAATMISELLARAVLSREDVA